MSMGRARVVTMMSLEYQLQLATQE